MREPSVFTASFTDRALTLPPGVDTGPNLKNVLQGNMLTAEGLKVDVLLSSRRGILTDVVRPCLAAIFRDATSNYTVDLPTGILRYSSAGFQLLCVAYWKLVIHIVRDRDISEYRANSLSIGAAGSELSRSGRPCCCWGRSRLP